MIVSACSLVATYSVLIIGASALVYGACWSIDRALTYCMQVLNLKTEFIAWVYQRNRAKATKQKRQH
jgi:hypothetical protein